MNKHHIEQDYLGEKKRPMRSGLSLGHLNKLFIIIMHTWSFVHLSKLVHHHNYACSSSSLCLFIIIINSSRERVHDIEEYLPELKKAACRGGGGDIHTLYQIYAFKFIFLYTK